MDISYFKLEIFLPESHLKPIQEALWSVDAGHIGRYDRCMSYSRVIGTWRPLEGTSPYLGEQGAVSEEPELKVEVTVRSERLEQALKAVKAAHPYEEPVINVIPLFQVGI